MKKILIVEDDLSIAELERDYLELDGYEAEIAVTGGAGIKAAQEKDFDLIVLDIMLPDMDGFHICKELRKSKNIPIIFVTAKPDDVDKVRGFSAGADDYITKPFSFNEFLARVSGHLSRFEKLTSHGRQTEIQIRGLRINTASHEVFIEQRKISLPNKEFELLSFLAQNPDEVFSKEKLLDMVWGADAYVEPNTVAVHINRLREKIEKDPAEPKYLKTLWGVGYKLSL